MALNIAGNETGLQHPFYLGNIWSTAAPVAAARRSQDQKSAVDIYLQIVRWMYPPPQPILTFVHVQEEYSRIDLTVVCADGTQTQLPGEQCCIHPVLCAHCASGMHFAFDGYSPLSMCFLVAAALQKFGKTPLLMDDEMEAQYKMVYNRAMARNDASAEINLVSTCLASVACSPLHPRQPGSRHPSHASLLRLNLV